MNRSKCKKCKKWHPQLKDIASKIHYQMFKGCKCEPKFIHAAIEYEITVKKIIKGIIKISQKDYEMMFYLLED